MEFLERKKPYSFRFRLVNSLSGGRLKKYLTKALINLIRLRSNIELINKSGNMYITSSSMLEDIEIAIKFIYKIFEI